MAGNLPILLLITGLYFLITLGIVLWARYSRTGSTSPDLEEFFLAGRNLHPLVMVGTYVGTVFSAFFAIGFPGLVYTHGIAGIGFILLADVMGVFLILTYYKKLRAFAREHGVYSPIECLSKAYNSRWLGLAAALLMIFFLCPYISIQLVGIGKFLEGLSGGSMNYLSSVGTMVVIVAIYVVFGGMRAVAYTDVFQSLAIFLGLFCGAFFLIFTNWGSLGGFFQQALERTPERLSMPGPQGTQDFTLFVSMSIFSVALFFQPQLITRGIMAKDDRHLNIMAMGFLVAVMLATIPGVLLGLSGYLLYGDGVESNQIVGMLFENIQSAGLIGVVMTGFMMIGVLGASMSTADSFFLSIGQIFSRDVVNPFHDLSEKRQIQISRIIMLLVLGGAFFIGLNPPKLMSDLAVYSIAGATCLVPLYLGINWKRRSALGAILSMVAGTLVLAMLAFTKTKLFGLHEGFVSLLAACFVYLLSGYCSCAGKTCFKPA